MRASVSLLLTCLVVTALVCCYSESAYAAFCHGKPPTPGQPNTTPIYTAPPKWLKSVVNGTLYEAGQGDDSIWVAHVWGDFYSMGYAYGALLKDKMLQFFPQVWQHIEDQVTTADYVKELPKWLGDLIANAGLDVALDALWDVTKAYTPDYVEQEQRGIADATGADFKMIRRIHLIGEITKGRCSMAGMWGRTTKDGGLIQVRALDWDTDGPFQSFPAVIVYHPDQTPDGRYGSAWLNVGWAGWMGSITGVSSNRLAISEIGVSYPDDSWGNESVFGIPFVYLLRDILQFTYTLDDAISYMNDVQRTCHLILGVGDGKLGQFRGFQYSHSSLNVFDPLNQQPLYDWHPRINDTVYWGMDWLCPSYSQRLSERINGLYGQVTPANVISDIVSYTATGDLHVAVYDLSHNGLYVANARGANESGPFEAYKRQFVYFDLEKTFAEARPGPKLIEQQSAL